MLRGLTLVCLWLSLLVGAVVVRAEDGGVGRRVALVVGNSSYVNQQLALSNPKNDADDVAGALRALGFEVVAATDLSLTAFDNAVATFKEKARGAEVALFFYAGHAVQSDHVNYFIPVDANISQESQLRRGAISLDDVQAALAGVQGVQVLILDSCRDNPFSTIKAASRGLTMSRGLERITVTSGDSVVLYSTRANDVASDGAAGVRNSPFSRVLLDVLKRPGEHNLREMLWDVAAKVKAESGGKQSPELTMSLSGDYLFNLVNDRLEWDAVRTSLDPRAFRTYAARFPQSPFRKQAEQYAAVLEQQQLARRRDADAKARKVDEARVADDAVRVAKQKTDDAARTCWENYQKLDLLRTGHDRGGLERLAHDNSCPTLQAQIDAALASLTDTDRRQACDKIETEIGDYLQARNGAGLKTLGADAANCPGLGGRVVQALASLDAADKEQRDAEARRVEAERQQAVCDQDAGRLAALAGGNGARRIDDIAALGAASRCEKVRNDAVALAADLRRQDAQVARATQQRAACAAEGQAVRDATDKGNRSALEGLATAHQCDTLDVPAALAQFDDRVEKRRQEAAKACAAVDLAGLAAREDDKGLGDLAAKCPERADEVAVATGALKDKRRVADACRRESDELQRYVGTRQGAAVTALGTRAICPKLDIPGALAAIGSANCQTGLKALGVVRDDDEGALRDYAGNGELCADIRTRAQARLDVLTTARRDDAACDGALAEARGRQDLAALKGLLTRDICVRRKEMVARAIDDETRRAEQVRLAKVACDKATTLVSALPATDEMGLRRASNDAGACPSARTAAAAKLDALFAMRSQDASCDGAVAEAVGHGNLAALRSLQDDATCVRRRDVVAQALAGETRKAEQLRLASVNCEQASTSVGGTFQDDEAALRRLSGDDALCPAARAAAASRLDVIVAVHEETDRGCETATRGAAVAADVERITQLLADPICARRKPMVAVALKGATAARTKDGQQRLTGLGCFTGAATGTFDAATGQAVARYFSAKHTGGTVPTLFSADLIRDLSAESTQVCVQEARLAPDADVPPPAPQAVEPPSPPLASPTRKSGDDEEDAPIKRKKRKAPPVFAEPDRPRKPRVFAQPDAPRQPVVRERPAPSEPAPPVTSSAPKPHVFFN